MCKSNPRLRVLTRTNHDVNNTTFNYLVFLHRKRKGRKRKRRKYGNGERFCRFLPWLQKPNRTEKEWRVELFEYVLTLTVGLGTVILLFSLYEQAKG